MPDPSSLKPVQTVLCAIDLSDLSPNVLAMAAETAEAYEAKLMVIHAVEIWDKRYDFIVDDIAKRIELEAHGKLQAELDRLGKTRGVPVQVVVAKGQAGQIITDAIKKYKPDLVVVGSHGRRGIDHMLLGSVAERVVRTSPVSVLVVRPPRNPDIYTMVCAVDFSSCSRTALERAIEIARLDKVAAVQVLNVFEVPLGYLEAGMTYETAFNKTKAVHEQELAEFLKPYANCGVKLEPVIEEGAPGPMIVAYAEKVNADLLVIGAHGKSRLTAMLIGGASIKVVHRAKVPVLAVKSPEHFESLWQALDKL
jgi:nucleotide-binding universal stress UspA family protein